MCNHDHDRVPARPGEEGAAMIEYVMLLGFITALVIFLFSLLYPSAGEDVETLVNEWGDKIATQIAGDKITSATESAFAED